MALLHSARQSAGSMRYTAMAPARYVICAGVPASPADLADPAQWRRQPVLASGDGRSGPGRGGPQGVGPLSRSLLAGTGPAEDQADVVAAEAE